MRGLLRLTPMAEASFADSRWVKKNAAMARLMSSHLRLFLSRLGKDAIARDDGFPAA
jgi:hypothetical protein